VKRALLLDVVVSKRTAVLKLLARENEALLVRRNAFLVLDLALDVLDRVRRLDLESHSLARQRLDEHLHTTSQTIGSVQSCFARHIIVVQDTTVLKLLACEDEALLASGHACPLRNTAAHAFDGFAVVDLQRNSLAPRGLHEQLNVLAQARNVRAASPIGSRDIQHQKQRYSS